MKTKEQEKAEEIVNKYFKYLKNQFGDEVYSLQDRYPQDCALIAIDEIINMDHNIFSVGVYEYWMKVKKEIEKL